MRSEEERWAKRVRHCAEIQDTTTSKHSAKVNQQFACEAKLERQVEDLQKRIDSLQIHITTASAPTPFPATTNISGAPWSSKRPPLFATNVGKMDMGWEPVRRMEMLSLSSKSELREMAESLYDRTSRGLVKTEKVSRETLSNDSEPTDSGDDCTRLFSGRS